MTGAVVPELFELGWLGLRERQMGVVGLGSLQHQLLQLLLPLLLSLSPLLLLFLSLLPLLKHLSTQGDNLVKHDGGVWTRDFDGVGEWCAGWVLGIWVQ